MRSVAYDDHTWENIVDVQIETLFPGERPSEKNR